jgi:integrase
VKPGAEARRRRELLHEHLRLGQEWELLRALDDGLLHAAEVVRRLRQGGARAIPELRADVERARAGAVPTFLQEAGRYLEWYGRKRQPKSLKATRHRLKRIGEQAAEGGEGTVDDVPVPLVTTAMLERALEAVSSSPKTQEGLRAAASGLYSWSVARETDAARTEKRLPRWEANPASAVEVAEPVQTVTTATDEQILALIAGAELYQLAYLRAFLHLGLRADELVHTRLHADLDVERWLWRVQARPPDPRCRCLQCAPGGQGWSPKSKRGHRSFAVPARPEPLRGALGAYLGAHPAAPGDFFFRRPSGRGWSYAMLAHDFGRLCERAGVRYGRGEPGAITLHALRHTCATGLIRAGVRESVVADLLGDTLDTISRFYVHLTAEDIADGVSRGPAYD